MSDAKLVKARARVRCINSVNNKYTYPGEEFTFRIGPGKNTHFKELPSNWEEVEVDPDSQMDSNSEVETLLEVQIKGMSPGRISGYIMAYYGIKVDPGQAHETAYRQAMEIIGNPRYKRKPMSQILAGLNALNDTPPRKDEEKPASLPVGNAAPVVPSKDQNEGEKAFKDLSMDELDAIERDEIIAKVKRLYQVEMANAGNKTVVLNKALEIERSALETAEVSSEG